MRRNLILLILTAWLVTVIILLILIFSNRNSTSGESQLSLEITCDQFLAEKHITQNIRMQSGDSLGVSLCSNGTTGFQWEQPAYISDERILKQTLHKFVPPEGNSLGSAGKEEWEINTLKNGTSIVKLLYSRPWEGGEKSEWSLTLTVVVD
ncbi:MAG: hypothetical protein CL786_05455 [Chloroflexi bacterium]|nr:hypothetical protein [Chloroflexota bacterium]